MNGGRSLSTVKITLAQGIPVLGDKDANLGIMKRFVQEAAEHGSRLVIFGELFLTGYRIKDRVARLAETVDGPSVKRLVGLATANDCYILFGMPEKDPEIRGLIYNSAVLVGPDKDVQVYRKWFLPNFGPFEEKVHFTPGKEINLFMTDFGKVGVIICYDIFFPELAKSYVLKGADLLAVISASPSSSKPYFEILSSARAVENAIPLAYCNLVGVEEGLRFFGGSRVIGARGNIMAQAKDYEEDMVSTEIDFKETDSVRFHRATLRDTRPEIFEIMRGIS